MDARWREEVRERWRAAHEERSAQLARLEALDAAASAAPLGADEACERASLAQELRGDEAALPLAREAAERHPDHAPAVYGLGRMLLACGDADGAEHLRRAVQLDADAELPAAQLLAGFHLARGENQLATPWIARAEALGADRDAAVAERSEVKATDGVEPHRLEADQVEAVAAVLRAHPEVGRAWLVRKRLRHLPDRDPVHVVAVARRSTWWKLELSRKDDRLAQRLADALPALGRLFVFVKTGGSAPLFRRVKKVAGARVV
jgi:tetratricopeptide (TPR) repeat protein